MSEIERTTQIAVVHIGGTSEVDTMVSMHLRPRPWFMPRFIYKWLLQRLFKLNQLDIVHGSKP